MEEWSEWDERHEPLGREGSGERVGRRTSSIDLQQTVKDVSTSLDMTKSGSRRASKIDRELNGVGDGDVDVQELKIAKERK